MTIIATDIDLAKNIFAVHGINQGGAVQLRQPKRLTMIQDTGCPDDSLRLAKGRSSSPGAPYKRRRSARPCNAPACASCRSSLKTSRPA